MRRLFPFALLVGLLSPAGRASADPGDLNLHIDLAGELPIAGYYAFPSKAENSARLGGRLALALDYVIAGPLALEAIGSFGYLIETDADNSESGGIVGSVALGVRLRLTEARRLWLSAHVGYHRFDGHQLGLDAALGYDFRLSARADLGIFVRWQLTGLGTSQNAILDGMGGSSAFPDDHWDASLQVGVSISYALVSSAEPIETPDEPRPSAPNDRDGDRIPDSEDQCPDEPEDHDGVEDHDGCPEDDDRDGIPDHLDHCRDEPEDHDGFQDEDGCPDPDNDGDGTEDPADDCPLQPGPIWNGGCPEPDRDGDMIGDSRDNCPDEPGNPENQGCPTPQLVVITDNQLQILDSVFFRLNRHQIDPRSFPLLDNIASVLNAHPEIIRLRIEGHTDARGNARNNTRLSQRRADEVMKYLVRRASVEARRLEAVGYGPSRPIVPDASSEDDHARNRRVEFNIVQR